MEKLTENGLVTAVTETEIRVKFVRHSACGTCGKCGMTDGQKEIELSFKRNGENVAQGDTVRVEMPGGAVKISVLVLYVIPLVMLFVGLLIGTAVFGGEQKDVWSAVLGFCLMGICYAVVRIFEKRIRDMELFRPRLIKNEEEKSDE